MAIKEVPARYVYTCDGGCGRTYEAKEKIHSGFPSQWSELLWREHSYDYSGAAVADGSTQYLLCPVCTERTRKALERALMLDKTLTKGTT